MFLWSLDAWCFHFSHFLHSAFNLAALQPTPHTFSLNILKHSESVGIAGKPKLPTSRPHPASPRKNPPLNSLELSLAISGKSRLFHRYFRRSADLPICGFWGLSSPHKIPPCLLVAPKRSIGGSFFHFAFLIFNLITSSSFCNRDRREVSHFFTRP